MEQITTKDPGVFLSTMHVKALAYVTVRLKDTDLAQDIVQDTMIGFVRSAHRYETCAWRNLFYKILKRRIIDYIRKEQWRKQLRAAWMPPDDTRLEGEPDEGESHSCNPDSTGKNISHDTAQSYLNVIEMIEQLDVILLALPERQQEAYVLRNLQGYSIKEVARMMGCSENSVKSLTYRVLKVLRKQLDC